MPKKNAGQLRDIEIDWLLAQMLGVDLEEESMSMGKGRMWSPTHQWGQMGPILDALFPALQMRDPAKPVGHIVGEGKFLCITKGAIAAGRNYRQAVGRAAVIKTFGSSMDLPEWL